MKNWMEIFLSPPLAFLVFLAIFWGSTYVALGYPLPGSIPLSYAAISFLSIGYFFVTKKFAFFRFSALMRSDRPAPRIAREKCTDLLEVPGRELPDEGGSRLVHGNRIDRHLQRTHPATHPQALPGGRAGNQRQHDQQNQDSPVTRHDTLSAHCGAVSSWIRPQ